MGLVGRRRGLGEMGVEERGVEQSEETPGGRRLVSDEGFSLRTDCKEMISSITLSSARIHTIYIVFTNIFAIKKASPHISTQATLPTVSIETDK